MRKVDKNIIRLDYKIKNSKKYKVKAIQVSTVYQRVQNSLSTKALLSYFLKRLFKRRKYISSHIKSTKP